MERDNSYQQEAINERVTKLMDHMDHLEKLDSQVDYETVFTDIFELDKLNATNHPQLLKDLQNLGKDIGIKENAINILQEYHAVDLNEEVLMMVRIFQIFGYDSHPKTSKRLFELEFYHTERIRQKEEAARVRAEQEQRQQQARQAWEEQERQRRTQERQREQEEQARRERENVDGNKKVDELRRKRAERKASGVESEQSKAWDETQEYFDKLWQNNSTADRQNFDTLGGRYSFAFNSLKDYITNLGEQSLGMKGLKIRAALEFLIPVVWKSLSIQSMRTFLGDSTRQLTLAEITYLPQGFAGRDLSDSEKRTVKKLYTYIMHAIHSDKSDALKDLTDLELTEPMDTLTRHLNAFYDTIKDRYSIK